jgi:FMN reductase
MALWTVLYDVLSYVGEGVERTTLIEDSAALAAAHGAALAGLAAAVRGSAALQAITPQV